VQNIIIMLKSNKKFNKVNSNLLFFLKVLNILHRVTQERIEQYLNHTYKRWYLLLETKCTITAIIIYTYTIYVYVIDNIDIQ